MQSESWRGEEAPKTIDAVSRGPASGPWVLELGSPETFRSVVLHVGESVTVGSGAGASVRIEDRTVSALHCRLHATDRGVGVEDLHSKNGLYVGAARVQAALLCGVGSSFVLGRTTGVLYHCPAEATQAEQKAGVLEGSGLVGSSVPMRRLASEIERVARLRAPVLLCGESGTGKDLVAQAIHRLSGRSGPYVPLNASAVYEGLADAELFGHQRGAFTGAVASRTGAFEAAHRGTLFLDEVADLVPAVQVKLLRVVEDGLVRAVGSSSAVKVDVRLIAATWVDLFERMEEGRFRPDLFHRISTFVLELPPLRERRSDIPALARFLLAGFREELGPKSLSSAAVACLAAYDWPGNVRELRSVLYRAAASAKGNAIGSAELASIAPARPRHRKTTEPLDVVSVLREYGGNVTAAARAAAMPRTTFRSRLARAREQAQS